MSDDGFVDLTPPRKGAPPAAKVIIKTFRMRAAERLSLSIDSAFFPAERVVIAWNADTFELRITPDERGTFDVMRIGKSKRHVLRFDLPKGLQIAERAEAGPYRFEGKALFVVVPPPMRVPPPEPDRIATVAPAKPDPLSPSKAAIAQAKASVPAPSFSTRKL